jgi:hypothetical protein
MLLSYEALHAASELDSKHNMVYFGEGLVWDPLGFYLGS